MCHPAEYKSLENVQASISPEQEIYQIGEICYLDFSLIPDFSTYSKYEFTIALQEFNDHTKEFYPTSNIVFLDTENGTQKNSYKIDFSYTQDDLKHSESEELRKTFQIKITKTGSFLCGISGEGWNYPKDKTAPSGTSYDKSFYITAK